MPLGDFLREAVLACISANAPKQARRRLKSS
jgi:hypothetical protein